MTATRQHYPLMIPAPPMQATDRRMRRSKGRHAEPSTAMRYYDLPSRAVLPGGKHRAGRRVA